MDHELGKSVASIVQAAASLIMPVVVIVLGLKINRQLEANKVNLAREKEWQTKWADSFFSSASGFNEAVEDSIQLLFEVSQQPLGDPRGAIKEKERLLWAASERIQRTEWSLKTQVQFAPTNREAVLSSASKVIELCAQLFKEKQGNLESIRGALFNFNAAARAAHRELLALSSRP
jgi:hypothetical protein